MCFICISIVTATEIIINEITNWIAIKIFDIGFFVLVLLVILIPEVVVDTATPQMTAISIINIQYIPM